MSQNKNNKVDTYDHLAQEQPSMSEDDQLSFDNDEYKVLT
jgi:hypothetical protein